MRTIQFISILTIGLFLGSGPTSAQTVVFGDPTMPTTATSIHNLDVGGTQYDVEFQLDKFAYQIYGPFPGTFDIFDTVTEAEAASDSVNSALNGANATSIGDFGVPGSESLEYNIGYESFVFGPVEFIRVWRAGIEGSDDWFSWGTTNWTYRLDQRNWAVFTITTAVDDGADSGVPDAFELFPNYPNPFNPSTTIKYALPEAGNVELMVYDVLGNEVSTLVNEEKPAGINEVEWNASNVPSGVYFYSLSADGFVQTRKMLLMK